MVAICTLLIVCVLSIVLFERFQRRTEYNRLQAFLVLIAKALTKVLWRARLVGPVTMPETGPAIIVCNHCSSVDPFFIQTVLRRVVRWMVAREYCEHPLFGGFLRAAMAIPVNRGGIDTKSTKMAIRTVSEGGAVGMFPEGRINTTDEFMRPVRPGAIVVALKCKATIVPCYLDGAPYRGTAWSPFFMLAKVRVHFGEPIDVSEYYGQERDPEVVQRLLTQCVKSIAELAGRPDFEPTLAGRHWKSVDDELETADEDNTA
jgi:1-acyl-sn-glycerol-3-phosphate acyltransferase